MLKQIVRAPRFTYLRGKLRINDAKYIYIAIWRRTWWWRINRSLSRTLPARGIEINSRKVGRGKKRRTVTVRVSAASFFKYLLPAYQRGDS